MVAPKIERFLTLDQLAKPDGYLPFTRVHIYRLMKKGLFPPPKKLSANRVAWSESSIARWIESRPDQTTRKSKTVA